jgi:hypothetical protein
MPEADEGAVVKTALFLLQQKTARIGRLYIMIRASA